LIVNVNAFEVAPPGFCTVTLTVPGEAMRAAETEAVIWPAPMKLLDKADPFHCTVAPDTKLEPFTVKVNAAPPAVAEFGLRLDIESVPAGLIVNVNALEVAPPGFCTVTLAVPCDAIRVADTEAVNWLPPMKVVDKEVPFHITVALDAKLEPFTVRVNAAPPAVAEFGLRLDSEGGPDIVNVNTLEVAPPGFCTVTLAVPCEAMSVADTEAVNWLPLMKVVDKEVPFHITAAPDAKLDPFTVRVNAAPPAIAEFGLRLDIESVPGGLIVNVNTLEVAPPGFCTVTFAVPCEAMRAADTGAVNWLALTNVVVRADPFHCTVDPLTKSDPFTVRVNAALPAAAEFGLRLDSEGATG
jgi:hypothetical protein